MIFSPRCQLCSSSQLSHVQRGATIARLRLLCVVITLLSIPMNAVLFTPVTMDHDMVWDPSFFFTTPAQGFDLLLSTTYLILIASQFHKSQCTTDFDSSSITHFGGAPQNQVLYQYERAYRTFYELPHVILSYFEAIGWTMSFVTMMFPMDYEASWWINRHVYANAINLNEERFTLIVYQCLFVLVAFGASGAVAVLSTIERRKGLKTGMFNKSA